MGAILLLSACATMLASQPDLLLQKSCGPLALSICAGAVGQHLSLDEISTGASDGETEASLLQLKHAAERTGLTTLAVKWTGDVPHIPAGKAPAVLPVALPTGNRHFIALLESTGDALLIVDFPGTPVWATAAGLRQYAQWDGTALHVARDATALRDLRTATSPWPRLVALVVLAGAACLIVGKLARGTQRFRLRSPGRRHANAGFTIIELVVVMALIGILVALLAPALQSTRETVRRTDCQNRLRQLGTALQGYESAQGRFPSLSVPRATPKQGPFGLQDAPLSVCYQLLPFLEQRPLFERVDRDEDGYPGNQSEPPASTVNAAVLQVTIPILQCPSDRGFAGSVSYRSCAGTSPGLYTTPGTPLPNSSRAGFATGAVTRAQNVRDGLSNTAFFSERLLGDQDPSRYSPARDVILNVSGDLNNNFLLPDDAANGCQLPYSAVTQHASFMGATWLFSGYGFTSYNHVLAPNSRTPDCTTGHAVAPTGPGAFTARSMHTGGVYLLLGDGAVRFVSEEIGINIWRALGTINGSDVVGDF
jgi:prepilin-type N-terminal cleavage/methylation domain-containing protein